MIICDRGIQFCFPQHSIVDFIIIQGFAAFIIYCASYSSLDILQFFSVFLFLTLYRKMFAGLVLPVYRLKRHLFVQSQ